MSEELTVQNKELEKEASLIVSRISEPETRKELSALGNNILGTSSKSYGLMQQKMAVIIQENPKREALEDDMEDIKKAVQDLSPDTLGSLSFWQKLFTKNPVGKKLEKIKEGYESAESRLTSIEKGLAKGSTYLTEDNKELASLYGDIQSTQKALSEHIFVLEKVVDQIKGKYENDPMATPEDIMFESEMVNKLQDFKLMQEANAQFQVSINMTVQGNAALLSSVNRLSNIVGNVARSGLMVQASLLRQKSAINLVKGTKSFVGNVLKSNAEMVKSNVKETKELLSAPVLDMEQVQEAHNVLKEAVEEAFNCRNEVMQKSLQSLKKLDTMMKDLPQEEKPLEIEKLNK